MRVQLEDGHLDGRHQVLVLAWVGRRLDGVLAERHLDGELAEERLLRLDLTGEGHPPLDGQLVGAEKHRTRTPRLVHPGLAVGHLHRVEPCTTEHLPILTRE
jgi:hypothetical protein